jgi:hypothetical protein
MDGGGTYNRSLILLESFMSLPRIALQVASRHAQMDLAASGPICFGVARGMNLLVRCSAA